MDPQQVVPDSTFPLQQMCLEGLYIWLPQQCVPDELEFEDITPLQHPSLEAL